MNTLIRHGLGETGLSSRKRNIETNNVRLPPDTVVSRFADGAPASRLADLYWSWAPYVLGAKEAKLGFNFWGSPHRYQSLDTVIPPEHEAMVADMQHIMSLVIFKRTGETYTYGMLFAFLARLRAMAGFCSKRGLSLAQLLGDEKMLTKYGRSIKSKSLSRYSGLLSILTQLDAEKDIGFYVAGNSVLAELRRRVTDMSNDTKQTPPIPTRVYSLIITAMEQELADFENISSRYFKMIRESMGKREKCKPKSDAWKGITRNLIDADPDLQVYFTSKGLQKDPKGAIRGLNEVQIFCKLTIQAFSGMRHSEGLMLPFHCIETERRNGRTHYILSGLTTKLNKGKIRQTKWVTSMDGYRAASIARSIAKFTYDEIRVSPSRSHELKSAHPLFVSTSYLGFGMEKTKRLSEAFHTKDLLFSEEDHPRLRQLLCPLIKEEDLLELEAIDPDRAWRGENQFKIGQPWPLGSHQFRRSLALYAQRSGLVSLPSLKRQLQHITREMSRYYARGSVFAVNFIENDPEVYKKHVAKDWRETAPLSEALAFFRDVIFSEEELFGGAGAFEQGKRDRGELADRQATLASFRRGEISYKETPFGGCIKVGECNQVGLKILEASCLKDCMHAIGKRSKLDNVIHYHEELVAGLDPDSVGYRMETSDLRALKAARNKWEDLSIRRTNVHRAR